MKSNGRFRTLFDVSVLDFSLSFFPFFTLFKKKYLFIYLSIYLFMSLLLLSLFSLSAPRVHPYTLVAQPFPILLGFHGSTPRTFTLTDV